MVCRGGEWIEKELEAEEGLLDPTDRLSNYKVQDNPFLVTQLLSEWSSLNMVVNDCVSFAQEVRMNPNVMLKKMKRKVESSTNSLHRKCQRRNSKICYYCFSIH